MSYDVAVVVPPVSEVDSEAWSELDSVIDQPGPIPESLMSFYKDLMVQYPDIDHLPPDKVERSIWSIGSILENFGTSAGLLNISSSCVNEALPQIIELSKKHGLILFDMSSERIYRLSGKSDVSLTVEHYPDLQEPSIEYIHEMVDKLTPDGGPGFLVLSKGDRDYVQTAGGNGMLGLEWREYSESDYQHWAAGLHGQPNNNEVFVSTSGGGLRVKENEVLCPEDVKKILAAFLENRGRPMEFAWRDKTADFRRI